jgi:hypothetical protein
MLSKVPSTGSGTFISLDFAVKSLEAEPQSFDFRW